MIKCYAAFDVGFFDLVVIDEVHRSVFNRYREESSTTSTLSRVGLTRDAAGRTRSRHVQAIQLSTASPADSLRTRRGGRRRPPRAARGADVQPKYIRDGIRNSQMSEEERRQLDDQVPDPTVVQYEGEKVDRAVFNQESNRKILPNLMERGSARRQWNTPRQDDHLRA